MESVPVRLITIVSNGMDRVLFVIVAEVVVHHPVPLLLLRLRHQHHVLLLPEYTINVNMEVLVLPVVGLLLVDLFRKELQKLPIFVTVQRVMPVVDLPSVHVGVEM